MRTDRGRILKWLSVAFLLIWVVGFLWVVKSFMTAPHSGHDIVDRVLEVGSVDDLEVGQAELIRAGRDPLFVVRISETEFVGLSGVCTHLRCVLRWNADTQVFTCPCHNGVFDVQGNVIKGPPRRPLQRYQVETQLGTIYLHR